MAEDGVVVSGHSGHSVLIVDDDVIICSCVERALKPAYRVSSATSGKEALERIVARERFDVIVLDLMMPEIGGVQFLDELAAVAPDQVEAVIIATGGAFTPDSIAFVATTAMTVIEKPFDVATVKSIVADHLRRRRL